MSKILLKPQSRYVWYKKMNSNDFKVKKNFYIFYDRLFNENCLT